MSFEFEQTLTPAEKINGPGLVSRHSVLRDGLEILILIAIVYTLVNLATSRYEVVGPSMQPNFYTGEHIIVNRFLYFINPTLAASAQLAHLQQVLGNRQPDLPIALDVEKPVDSDPADVTQVVTDFVTLLTQQTGRKPLLYTAPAYWNSHIHGGQNWSTYDLWIANYGPSIPTLPHSWQTWRFWQYSGNGHTDGVSTPVDLDWFNGTESDLRAYAQQSGTTAAQAPAQASVTVSVTTAAQSVARAQTMYIVTRDGLRVHNNPDISAPVLQALPYRTALQVEPQSSGIFVKISSPLVGWVAKGQGSEVYISSTLPQP